ncbi:hypothetical protein MANES_02G070100v8 [Manihot esculenta]|uniref:Fatty acid hydroxylase domain-containing protein n=2 Tax=Manihot esculenta TaxID=3983 RepID=A0A2C9WD50_MANES|nr:hypothetical protein MANES_02G070100v8 [Manihot esculenta]
MEDKYLHLFLEETSLYNNIVLGHLLPSSWWVSLPRFCQAWLRNYIAGSLLYLTTGFLCSFYVYYLKRNVNLPKDAVPTTKVMLLQIYVSMKAMPWYCALPSVSEYMVEKGWTKCFARVSDVGWLAYIASLIAYLVVVEFLVYWAHREMHDIKPLYKYLHVTHHKYNKRNILSPFAGMAFQPLDGVVQAVPHVIALFIVPTHFRSHIALFFAEAIWTANIHDCIHGKVWPIMGAGYHTIHHTTNRHNYGHYTIWMDWMLGTLRDPKEDAFQKAR